MSGRLEIHGPNLTAEQVRRLVTHVNKSVETLGYSLSVLFNRRGWLALGYADWSSFCAVEFQSARDSLSRAGRRMAVIEAAQEGMSGNAIATALGISAMTVSRDLAEAGVRRETVIDEHGNEQDVAGRGRRPGRRGPGRGKASSDRAEPAFPVAAFRTTLRRVGANLDSVDTATMRTVLRDALRLLEQWEAAVGLADMRELIGTDEEEE
jgi:hypothetical protein